MTENCCSIGRHRVDSKLPEKDVQAPIRRRPRRTNMTQLASQRKQYLNLGGVAPRQVVPKTVDGVEKGSLVLCHCISYNYTKATLRRPSHAMMGNRMQTTAMFQYFCLDDWVPADHLLRAVDRHIDLRPIREQLRPLYSEIGRPSIDPEVLLRILLIGYLYGITSERRLLDEIGLNLAYRWFTGLGFDQSIPDHSTFSKNRHGRFRDSSVFRDLFRDNRAAMRQCRTRARRTAFGRRHGHLRKRPQ